MADLILYSLIGGLFSLAGGFLILWRRRDLEQFMLPLLSFAAGAFLATAFFDILPEALEAVDEPHVIMIWLVAGFVAFFTIERFLMRTRALEHNHSHADHTESLPLLIIFGDTLHNFMDGILIGLAFIANPAAGLATALAVAAHEIPQEIGDFTILLNQKWHPRNIIGVNVAQSLATLPGAFLGYWGGQIITPSVPLLLAFASGIFIYLGASSLIPEIHHQAEHRYFWRVFLPFIFSLAIVYYFILLAHH